MSLSHVLYLFSLCGVCQLVPVGAHAQLPSTKLSLFEAITLAQKNSAKILAAQARVSQARARAQGSGLNANPNLAIAHAFGQNTGGMDEDILLTQTFTNNRKRGRAQEGARAGVLVSEAEQENTRLDLVLAVQIAYIEALQSTAETEQSEAFFTMTQKFLDAAKVQLEAGDAPRSAVIRAEIELSRAAQALETAKTDQVNRLAVLQSLLGETNTITLTDTLTFTPQKEQEGDLTKLESDALARRTDLLSLRKAREVKIAERKLAQDQKRPDVFLEGRRASIQPHTPGESIRIGVTFPLLDKGQIKTEIKVADAAIAEQDALILDAERVARLEIGTAYRNYAQARRTVESFPKGRLARAKEIVEMVQIGYEKGANSLLEVLDAQRVYRDEQLEYVRALARYQIAEATFNNSLGVIR